jgi:hypothetical protein
VTKDRHWQGLEVAYLSATIKAIESGRAIPDEEHGGSKNQQCGFTTKKWPESLTLSIGMEKVANWIMRVLRYQEWQKCENEVSKKQGDPRMCFPPWSIAAVMSIRLMLSDRGVSTMLTLLRVGISVYTC